MMEPTKIQQGMESKSYILIHTENQVMSCPIYRSLFEIANFKVLYMNPTGLSSEDS